MTSPQIVHLYLAEPLLVQVGVHPRILDLRIVVFMGVSLEIGCQHDAARIGVLGHREADRRAAVAAAGAGRPARKDKALVRHCSHSCRRAAPF